MEAKLCYLVALLAVGATALAPVADDDDMLEMAKHCREINGTHDSSYFDHKLCNLRCVEHYRMSGGQLSDDGLVCSYRLEYACRDGLCRQDNVYPMDMAMISNVDIDVGEINNHTHMYAMLCLGAVPNGKKLETVELPLLDRAHCSRCSSQTTTSPLVGEENRILCQKLDKWDVNAQTILTVENFMTRESESDVFVGGELFHLPAKALPSEARISNFELISKLDAKKHFRFTWHIKWDEAFV